MSEIVPEGWKLEPLSVLADYHNGRAFKPEDWSKEGLPILRIAQINDPFRETDFYKGSDILDKHLIKKGDLVFSWSATLKAILWGHYDAILNQHIFKVIEKPNVSRAFLQQLLDHSIEKLAESSHGSTMKHIKKGVLDEFHRPIPPLPEQKKIASILTSVDEVIETTQKQIDKLQDLKKATMNELLTKGIGHTEFKESELGRIPKSWEVRTIRELITKVVDNRGKTPPLSSEGRELIELASILKSQRFLDYKRSKKRVSENTYKTWFRNGHPQIGDILVPTVGLIGECSIVSENRGCIAQNVIALRCSDNLLGDYLYWLMYSEYVLSEIKRVLMGAVQPSLKVPHLLDTRIPLPPTDEQIKILETLNTIENAVIDNQKKVASFQSLKKSLMQDLLTGKVRVQVN